MKILLTIFCLVLLSSYSFSQETLQEVNGNLHILGYVTDKTQSSYDCKNYISEGDYGDYYCLKNRNSTDKIIFNSDPYTELVGTIFRYILLDKSQIKQFKLKMIDKYGTPNVRGHKELNKGQEEIDEVMGWGNVKFEYMQGFGRSIGSKNDKGASVRLYFVECKDTWFIKRDCPGLFDIDENPQKVIAQIYMFGESAAINSNALSFKRDPREPKQYKQIDTKDAIDIDL